MTESSQRWDQVAADALAGKCEPVLGLSDTARRAFVAWTAERHVAALVLDRVRGALAGSAVERELAAVARCEMVVSLLQERELRRLLSAFAAAGVSPVLLKGTALAYSVYTDPVFRPRRDVDFIIDASDEAAVRHVLDQLGYEPDLDVPGRLISAQFHYSRTESAGLHHSCDVHLKIANSLPYADYLTYDAIARDAMSLPRLHPAAMGPATPHSLIVACVHRVAHHYDSDDVIWLWDIHLLATSLPPPDWQRVCALSAARQLSPIVLRGLERAREAFGGDAYSAQMEPLARAARHETAPSMFGPGTIFLDVVSADLAALPTRRARLQLLREHLFPPIAYLRQRYPGCPAALLPLAYVYRFIRGAPKWLRQRTR